MDRQTDIVTDIATYRLNRPRGRFIEEKNCVVLHEICIGINFPKQEVCLEVMVCSFEENWEEC